VAAALAAASTRGLPAAASTVAFSKRHLVGRAAARAELRDALDQAAEGRGLLVCVSGEPGIGKTALVEDILAGIADAASLCHVARGRCSERLAGTEAYLPLLDALDDLLRSDDGALAR